MDRKYASAQLFIGCLVNYYQVFQDNINYGFYGTLFA